MHYNIIKKVFENTINSNNNYNIKINPLNVNDTVLIFNNFYITFINKSNILKAEKRCIKKKNDLYNICGTIIKYEG